MINAEIISLLDLTRLDESATSAEIQRLSNQANRYKTAAICVLPKHIQFTTPHPSVRCATVVNFPTGNESITTVLSSIEQISKTNHAQEIDYVFPYEAYLNGNKVKALDHCAQAYSLCKEHTIMFKVIIETGALASEQLIYEVSLNIIKQGCDFLKTSTGKICTGATIESVSIMLSAILDSKTRCGIKISGGIKTKQQALSYIHLAQTKMGCTVNNTWFRIGASSLLNELLM